MAFGDETEHTDRVLNCGWGPRAESAVEIARRLQLMASEVKEAEPDLNALWPAFGMRSLRPSDPGPVDALSIDDLGRLIDRRARFDPPQLPEPVGPWGYKVLLEPPPSLDRDPWLQASLHAGGTGPGLENRCVLGLDLWNAAWRDAGRGAALLRSLIRAWEPDWALAYAALPQSEEDEREGRVWRPVRPWLGWQKPGGNPMPYEFIDVGDPAVVRAELGGELHIWP